MIDIVAPHVDPVARLPRQHGQHPRHRPRHLVVAVRRVECRLGNPAPRADFGVHLRRTHGIPIDAELLGEDGSRDSDTGEAWQRLRRFAGAWCERESILWRAVPAVSLEFDVHSPAPARVAAPSIFFSMRFAARGEGRATRGVEQHGAVIDAVLEGLGVDAAGAARQAGGVIPGPAAEGAVPAVRRVAGATGRHLPHLCARPAASRHPRRRARVAVVGTIRRLPGAMARPAAVRRQGRAASRRGTRHRCHSSVSR